MSKSIQKFNTCLNETYEVEIKIWNALTESRGAESL